MSESTTSVPYVFLSYASAEQDRALAVGDALQQAGIAIWLDRHAIAGGSAWSTEIVRGIRSCSAFLVLGSERAFRSPNVQRELNLAVEENRPVVPLLLEQVTAPDDVRYALAGRQWVALLDRPQDAWLPEVLRAFAGLGIVPGGPPVITDPVAAVPVSPPTNLPAPLTSFLGREQEIADLTQLLASNRLVTLTGPGPAGSSTASALLKGSINRQLIVNRWDDLLRVAGSLKLGWVSASLLIARLQASPRQNALTRALQEYGRLMKTLFVLRYLESEEYRRRINRQLNKGEALHALRRFLFFAERGTIRQHQQEDQANQAS